MADTPLVFQEVSGLYQIIPLRMLRRTPGVSFDLIPVELLPRIDGIDRVLHADGAISPGPTGSVARPWYMHPHQDDNLIVLHGTRFVDIYIRRHGRVESFVVTADRVLHEGETVYDGPAMLVWPRGVFHRIESDKQTGSASLNFAVRYAGFDLRTNFDVYDLDLASGDHRVVRAGYLDQPMG
jgi:hypothetical protein